MRTALAIVVLGCWSWLAGGAERPQALPNYDRREERAPATVGVAAAARAQGRQVLRTVAPDVEIAEDPVVRSPRMVGSSRAFLTGPSGEGRAVKKATAAAIAAGDRHRPLKAFLNEHRRLFGHDASVLAGARIAREDVSAKSGLRTVVWEQEVEGTPGRMQMYVFTGPTPDRDGDFDAEIVKHGAALL